jgi:hypothetical protein
MATRTLKGSPAVHSSDIGFKKNARSFPEPGVLHSKLEKIWLGHSFKALNSFRRAKEL